MAKYVVGISYSGFEEFDIEAEGEDAAINKAYSLAEINGPIGWDLDTDYVDIEGEEE